MLVMPPLKTSFELNDNEFSTQVIDALHDYSSLGRSIHVEEWEEINRNILQYFGFRTVSQFEKSKRDITVRQEYGSDFLVLFTDENEEICIPNSPEILGSKLKQLLRK
jgi:hypothetical protein